MSEQSHTRRQPTGATLSPEEQIDEWLRKPEIGLRFDPFRIRDAGSDPRLSWYLVDHGAFTRLWGDRPSFVFAPAGGGKTAFRVRLTHACRAGEGARLIFPVVVAALDPTRPCELLLTQAAASELLFHLLYFPQRFITRNGNLQPSIRDFLDENLETVLKHRLDQLDDLLDAIQADHNWERLAESFDPAAGNLTSPPPVAMARQMIASLRAPLSSVSRQAGPSDHFNQLHALLREMGYQAIYVLVDGVDAYPEAQRGPAAIEALRPLLEHTAEWAGEHIYVKYFLPVELLNPMQTGYADLLTNLADVAIINWDAGTLREVISRRLMAASEEYRAVSSLDALSTPALRDAESELLQIARPLPRDLVLLVEQMFVEHVLRVGPQGRLEPADLDAAIRWYRRPGSGIADLSGLQCFQGGMMADNKQG